MATGGAAKSALWSQIVSDIVALTQECPRDGDAIGDAFLTADGARAVRAFAAIRGTSVPVREVTRLDDCLRVIHNDMYGTFRDTDEALGRARYQPRGYARLLCLGARSVSRSVVGESGAVSSGADDSPADGAPDRSWEEASAVGGS